MSTYDIITQAIREYWKINFMQPVIAFFYQKYEWEKEWEWCEVLAQPQGIYNGKDVIYEYDFNEGQTQAKNIKIVSLYDVTEFYAEQLKLKSPE